MTVVKKGELRFKPSRDDARFIIRSKSWMSSGVLSSIIVTLNVALACSAGMVTLNGPLP